MTQAGAVNFLDLDFYSGGFLLPEGTYAMEHNIVLHTFTDKDGNTKGDPRLGVMLTAHPINEQGQRTGPAINQFQSMGTKAHLSYMPNESGKGLDPVPGGPGMVSNKANWFYYLESLYNTGLPKGTVSNDISALDGIWVRTANIPEPEDRKGFGSSTGEVEQPKRGNNKMPIVTEILDGGRPWEGSGGIPDESDAPATKTPAKPGPKGVVKPATTTKVAPKPSASDELDETVLTAATNGIASVLTKPANAKGMVKLMLKTQTFKAVKDAESDEMAQKVANHFFGADDSALSSLLSELSFKLNGTRIDPVV